MKFYKINIYGRVHGVGFRFSVLNTAKAHDLLGSVRNTHDGVEIIINDKDFIDKINIPSFARIDNKTIEEIDISKSVYTSFRIIESSY